MRPIKALLASTAALALLSASPAFATSFAQIPGTGTGFAQADWLFSGTTSVTQNLSSSVPANSLLVSIAATNAAGVTTPGYTATDTKGNIWHSGTLSAQVAAGTQILWTVTASPMTTSDAVTVTQGGGIAGLSMILGAWSGEDTSSPLDVQAVNDSGGSAVTSLTVGPTGALACPGGGAGCGLAICAMMWRNNGTITTDAAYTRFGTGNTSVPWSFGFKLISSTTAAQSCTDGNSTSDRVSAAMAVFKAAAGGGPTPKWLMRSTP